MFTKSVADDVVGLFQSHLSPIPTLVKDTYCDSHLEHCVIYTRFEDEQVMWKEGCAKFELRLERHLVKK